MSHVTVESLLIKHWVSDKIDTLVNLLSMESSVLLYVTSFDDPFFGGMVLVDDERQIYLRSAVPSETDALRVTINFFFVRD